MRRRFCAYHVVLVGVMWAASTGIAISAPTPASIAAAQRAAALRRQIAARLISQHKATLLKDPSTAYRLFQTAYRLAPTHPEANFYLAVSRLLSWSMRYAYELRSLGFQGPRRRALHAVYANPFRFMVTAPRSLRLPESLSNGAEIQQRLTQAVMAELQASLTELARVPDTFASSLPARNPLTGSPAIEVDGADVALLRAALHAALASCRLAQLYDVEAEILPLVARAEEEESTLAAEVLEAHPRLLRIRDAAQAGLAKDALLAAIDAYLAADALLRAETDDQRDDLFTFSTVPADVQNQEAFRQALVDLRNSLAGLSNAAWGLTLDQFLHVGDFFDRPVDLRALETGQGIQDFLLSHLLYQSERALTNLRNAPVTFSERIDQRVAGTSARPLELDYGDLLALQGALESFNAAAKILASYNAELSLPQTASQAGQADFDLDEAVLAPHPQLLQVTHRDRLAEGRIRGAQALRTVLDALAYARSSEDPDQSDDLVPLVGDRPDRIAAHLRPQLEALQSSLQARIDLDPEVVGDELLVNLAPIFDVPLNPREVLPQFDGVTPRPDTLPDPTLGGILPEATRDTWER